MLHTGSRFQSRNLEKVGVCAEARITARVVCPVFRAKSGLMLVNDGCYLQYRLFFVLLFVCLFALRAACCLLLVVGAWRRSVGDAGWKRPAGG